jgi:hypothetical protein
MPNNMSEGTKHYLRELHKMQVEFLQYGWFDQKFVKNNEKEYRAALGKYYDYYVFIIEMRAKTSLKYGLCEIKADEYNCAMRTLNTAADQVYLSLVAKDQRKIRDLETARDKSLKEFFPPIELDENREREYFDQMCASSNDEKYNHTFSDLERGACSLQPGSSKMVFAS